MPPCDYPSRLLVEPRVCAAGVEHFGEGPYRLLRWSEIAAAHAAEVGEPQGVRTIVFDLVVSADEGRVALRLDAEPGQEAQRLAQMLAQGLGDRALPSLKSLASDGVPTRWYPDLWSFEEAAQEELG